jgi:hypothetical protein
VLVVLRERHHLAVVLVEILYSLQLHHRVVVAVDTMLYLDAMAVQVVAHLVVVVELLELELQTKAMLVE